MKTILATLLLCGLGYAAGCIVVLICIILPPVHLWKTTFVDVRGNLCVRDYYTDVIITVCQAYPQPVVAKDAL